MTIRNVKNVKKMLKKEVPNDGTFQFNFFLIPHQFFYP